MYSPLTSSVVMAGVTSNKTSMLSELKYKIPVKLNAVLVFLCYLLPLIKLSFIIVGHKLYRIQIRSHKNDRKTCKVVILTFILVETEYLLKHYK